MPKVYLASPLGFAASTRDFMTLIERQLEGCGYTVVNPWRLADPKQFEAAAAIENTEQRRQSLHSVNMKTAAANEKAIRECEVMVAVLDGADVDSGTASEVGFAYAVGKRIYGYRGDLRRAGDNEGSTVNLQLEYWIENSGGCIVTDLDGLCQWLGGAAPAP